MSLNAVLSLLFLFSVCNYVICVWIGFSYNQDFLIGCQKFTEISIPFLGLCLLVTYIEKVEKVDSDIKVEMI